MKKRFLALALGTLAFGVTLGGVKMGLGHQDALMVKAAESNQVVFNASSQTGSTSLSQGVVTIAVDKGAYTENPFCILGNKSEYRFYAGTNITVSSSGLNISSIVFECTANNSSKYGPGNLNCESVDGKYTFSDKNGTWAGSSASVSFTPTAQVRATKITVTLQSSEPIPDPEPSSPIKSISAGLKNPGAVFYVGNKVTLDDFVITVTREDGKTEELTSDVVLKNDTLVEGANIIEFEYVENGKTFTCTCQVPAIAKPLYTKLANIGDLVVGKKILIASENGLKVLGANKGNNRAEVDATPTENKIEYNSNFAPLLVVPAKNGTFGLYDQNEGGLLYAGSSGSNYLKTTSDFSYVNENAFANISLNGTEWSIKFTGKNTRNLLRYNSSSQVFSCYGSGQGPISIYVSDEDPVAFDTEKWAKDFNDKLGVICDPTGETALTATKWNEAKKIFDDLSIPNKMAVKYGATDGVEMSKALKAYDFIIKTKYASLDDFLDHREETRANALMLPGATDSTTWTLVGIGAVTIAASASLLFFRRKKSN
ncbi:MAG: LPXTG cell wall anchor domain-containing protein [Mollicutes bacterium]|nr:LPXTG cell wall anchor domain-containing protein [Mollicutes bacterium]